MPGDGHNTNATSLSLLRRAKSDDQQAWERLVQLYGPLVYAWCRRASLQQDDMADAFQETFRAVATGLSKFQPQEGRRGSFRAWLRTVTRSKIANHFQSLNKQPQGKGGTEANLMIGAAPDPLAEDTEEEVLSDHAMLVRRAMDMIKPEFNANTWTAFEQVAIEGRAVADVAAELAMNAQAVRQANYRVRRRMKTELEGLFEV